MQIALYDSLAALDTAVEPNNNTSAPCRTLPTGWSRTHLLKPSIMVAWGYWGVLQGFGMRCRLLRGVVRQMHLVRLYVLHVALGLRHQLLKGALLHRCSMLIRASRSTSFRHTVLSSKQSLTEDVRTATKPVLQGQVLDSVWTLWESFWTL